MVRALLRYAVNKKRDAWGAADHYGKHPNEWMQSHCIGRVAALDDIIERIERYAP